MIPEVVDMVVDNAGQRPTMRDVSRLAGVSQTTVSLVLSGRDGRIRGETKQRILDAVAQLDYRPNLAAQSLRLGRSRTIGFITEEIAVNGFSGALISGLHDLARQRDSLLLMVNTTRNPERLRSAVRDLLDRQVDSIVYAPAGTREVDFPDVPSGTPILLVNAFDAAGQIPGILPDERAGGRAAVDHLLDQGHERVAFIAGRPGAWATQQRLLGFRDGLEAAGLDPDASPVLQGNYRFDSGYELTMQLMARDHSITALMMGNDQMASGALLALARLGANVPEDVSVVGYDDEPLASLLKPSLTTVRIPFYEMGHYAAERLLGTGVTALPPHTYLPCPLVARTSSVPPPGQ